MWYKGTYLWNRNRVTDRRDSWLPRGMWLGKGQTGSLGLTNYYTENRYKTRSQSINRELYPISWDNHNGKEYKKSVQRNSLAIQWLGLSAFTARAQMQPLVRELRSCRQLSQGKKKYMCVHLSHCVVQKKLIQHCKSTVFQ